MLHSAPFLLTNTTQKIFSHHREANRPGEAEEGHVSHAAQSASGGSGDELHGFQSETYLSEAIRNAPSGDEPDTPTGRPSRLRTDRPVHDGLALIHAEHRELDLLMSEYRKTPIHSSEGRAKKLALMRQLLELFEQQRHCESQVVLPVLLGLGMGEVGRTLYERNLVDLSVSDQLACWLWSHMPPESGENAAAWRLFESTAEKFMLCVDEHRREQNDQVLSRLSGKLDGETRTALHAKWVEAKQKAPKTTESPGAISPQLAASPHRHSGALSGAA
eukprot:GDKI01029769.1.p1 GENE.GDKI01029769.1~~GDKI01029769.1.p1  ORF type:complete len:275 (-),score=65.34 GDKI01029769.1:328-1152(-)